MRNITIGKEIPLGKITKKMKFLANLTDKNEILHTPYIRNGLSKFPKDQKVTIEVKKLFNKRSLDQNALMWVWFDVLADYTGHSSEEIHQIVKGLYCPKKNIKLNKFGNKTYSINPPN